MELAIFAGIMFLVVIASTAALVVAVKLLARGGKGAGGMGGMGGMTSTGAGQFLSTIEGAGGSLAGRLSSGVRTHGSYFDEAESFGREFISAGILDDATWQPVFEAIAKKLTTHTPKPQPGTVVEVPAGS